MRRRSGPWRATEQVRAGTAARRRCGAALAPRLSLELEQLALRRLSSRSSRMFWRDLASLSSLSPSLPQNTSFPKTPTF